MKQFKHHLRTLIHWAVWMSGSYLLALFLFCNDAFMASVFGAEPLFKMLRAGDVSVLAFAMVIAFFGAFRTLGHFTFTQTGRDMAENARNNPQSYDGPNPSSGSTIGVSPQTGEMGTPGSIDSKGNVIV